MSAVRDQPAATVTPRPDEERRPGAGGALLLAAASAAGFVLLSWWAVWTPAGQSFDDRAMVWIAAHLPGQGVATDLLGVVSAGAVLLGTVVLALLALAVHGPRRAVAVAGVAAGLPVLARLLKLVLDRPDLVDGSANSLPSGHTAAVAGLAMAFVLAVPGLVRGLTLALVVPVVLAAGYATVVLQWHRPSDAAAAALLAVTVGALAHVVAPPRRRRSRA